MIVGLFTELIAPGGVQLISKHTALVLSEFSKKVNENTLLYSFNDSFGYHEIYVNNNKISVRGFGRNKIKFVLAVLLNINKIKLLYVSHPNLSPLGLITKLINSKSKYIVSCYGIDVWKPLSILLQLSLRKSDVVTALSKFTCNSIAIEQNVDKNKICIIPPALDPDFLEYANSADIQKPILPKGKIILTVCRLDLTEVLKGIEVVIDALPDILKSLPDVNYVIVGDGEYRKRLEEIVKEKGLSTSVIFVGVKRDRELAAYYKYCDLFVMPSKKEGFGIVFLEAMVFGKPVIGGNHGGTPDIISNGKNGYLVNYGDVNSLIKYILHILQNKDVYDDIANFSKRFVQSEYTYKHFHHKLTKVFQSQYENI